MFTPWQKEPIDATRELICRRAGSHAEWMLESESQACALLTHDDAIIRFCAINCCDIIWNCGERGNFLSYCISAIATDPDENVRRSALRVIGSQCHNTKRRDVQTTLAHLVKDNQWSNMLRSAAYITLWQLEFGNLNGIIEHLTDEADAFRDRIHPSLTKIDWDFVNGFVSK